MRLYNYLKEGFFKNLIKPSDEVKRIKKNPGDIIYIKDPSEEIQLLAVKQNGMTIGYIKNPSEKVQIAAVKQNPMALGYINNPSPKIKKIAKKGLQGIF